MPKRANILIVDDDASNLSALQAILERELYAVVQAKSAKQALSLFHKEDIDLIVSDLRMPGMDGLELLQAIRKISPDVPMILLTAYGTVDNAVEAMKIGAVDFLNKPTKRKELLNAVANSLQKVPAAKAKFKPSRADTGFIGDSPKILEIKKSIQLLATSPANILIEGESGTGKEVVANAIHHTSGLRGKLVSVNCAAIPSSLLESELFGFVKGAFTGATADKPGIFDQADRGTLFLDEIGEIPHVVQVKLLRVLQERSYYPVGSTKVKSVNFRLVAATNANLEAKVHAGEFREDLYYRLNVVNIRLPPLRERKLDIPLLAKNFLHSCMRHSNRTRLVFGDAAMQALIAYDWPGNVRELQNKVERAVALAKSDYITPEDLNLTLIGDGPKQAIQEQIQIAVGTPLKDVESEVIEKTLRALDGNKELAAKVLGIGVRTIYRKLQDGSVEL